MQNIKPCPAPLLNPRTNPPPHFILFIYFFFLLFQKFVADENKYLSSVYPEINFPAESVMKINNLSWSKVSTPPPQNQMVVPLP